MYPYRIFISYAHTDMKKIERIALLLQNLGLIPIWDKDITGGMAFDDVIRKQIAQAHLFMPVLTSNSSRRLWVHQEIGYALGIGVPVIPMALGALPKGMLSGIQAICVRDDLSDVRKQVERTKFDSIVLSCYAEAELERLGITAHLTECREGRTKNLASCAGEISQPAPIRQRALFSSFSIPNAPADHHVWDDIEIPERRSDYYRTLLREERKILEWHAREAGCSLILNPFISFSIVGAGVHRTQLNLLRDFLVSIPKKKIRVAFDDGNFQGNLTIVGDWFGTKALPPKPGSEYRQTVFCRQASTVLRWVRDFDREFKELLHANGIKANESRDHAVERIDTRLKELPMQ